MSQPAPTQGPSRRPWSIRPALRSDADVAARLALEPPGGLNAIVEDPAVRLRIARATFLAEGTGFGYPHTLVAERDDAVVGIVARFTGREWAHLRMSTGFVMLRAAGLRYAAHLVRRGRAEERLMPPIPPDVLYVMSLAVLPGARGMGAGSALLRTVLGEGRRRGVASVALDVAEENEAAVRLYLREGFVVASEHRAPPMLGMPAQSALRMVHPLSS